MALVGSWSAGPLGGGGGGSSGTGRVLIEVYVEGWVLWGGGCRG